MRAIEIVITKNMLLQMCGMENTEEVYFYDARIINPSELVIVFQGTDEKLPLFDSMHQLKKGVIEITKKDDGTREGRFKVFE